MCIRDSDQTAPDPADEDQSSLRIGQMVWHAKFGYGRICDLRAVPLGGSAVVRFRGSGEKTIILRYGKLEPADFED